jgi:chemotaxis methyl-accepting protein methylase
MLPAAPVTLSTMTGRDRYFSLKPNGYQLAANVQRQVHFEQGNLFDDSFFSSNELYDIVFCRPRGRARTRTGFSAC